MGGTPEPDTSLPVRRPHDFIVWARLITRIPLVNLCIEIGTGHDLVRIQKLFKIWIGRSEFARQAEEKGASITEAAVSAARTRLRPILMTSFAFILGVAPLVVTSSHGPDGK